MPSAMTATLIPTSMDITRQPRSEAGRSWLAAVPLVIIVVIVFGAMAMCAGRKVSASGPSTPVPMASSMSAQHHGSADVATGRVRVGPVAAVGSHREPRTRTAPTDPTVVSALPAVRSDRFAAVEFDLAVRTAGAADIAASPRAPPVTTPSLFR